MNNLHLAVQFFLQLAVILLFCRLVGAIALRLGQPQVVGEMIAGVLLCGVATGMYIGANLGPGPRDGLMTSLHFRTGRSLRLVGFDKVPSPMRSGRLPVPVLTVAVLSVGVNGKPVWNVLMPLTCQPPGSA